MTDTPRTRARQAELTDAQRRELDQSAAAVGKALEEVERHRQAYARTAHRIADELGRGGTSALARHLGTSSQYVSALIASARTVDEGSAAA
ncbi:hypothetical protein [Streptomyces lavendulae]|uniref:hypothetical protein n=1 Tax=Streptomyces lavendulae TaxID=1914 RepID=UPI0025576529|nr:hypothetical protein [Streptomyces lavendulae]